MQCQGCSALQNHSFYSKLSFNGWTPFIIFQSWSIQIQDIFVRKLFFKVILIIFHDMMLWVWGSPRFLSAFPPLLPRPLFLPRSLQQSSLPARVTSSTFLSPCDMVGIGKGRKSSVMLLWHVFLLHLEGNALCKVFSLAAVLRSVARFIYDLFCSMEAGLPWVSCCSSYGDT